MKERSAEEKEAKRFVRREGGKQGAKGVTLIPFISCAEISETFTSTPIIIIIIELITTITATDSSPLLKTSSALILESRPVYVHSKRRRSGWRSIHQEHQTESADLEVNAAHYEDNHLPQSYIHIINEKQWRFCSGCNLHAY
ncbi:hypothetical protein NQZ68_017981 [Dissostichus eleginoides]|nr:hypothetical protein NQZ68_017981 [Dissostichus eleginoides]